MADTLVPVTDPELLKLLNSPDTPTGPAQGASTPVTDPALLAQLNGTPAPTNPDGTAKITYRPDGTADLSAHRMPDPFAKSSLIGVGRGILDIPGAVGDLANLAQLGYGKVTGDQGIQDSAHAGLRGENGFDMGTAALDKVYDKLGLFNQPPTPDTGDYAGGKFAGNVVASTGGPGAIKGLTKTVAPELAADAAKAGVSLPSTALGNTYGAQGIVRDAQRASQGQLADYGKGIIAGAPDAQTLGVGIADKIPAVKAGLTKAVDDAYAARDALMPAGGAYDTTNLSQAYATLAGQGVQNPKLAAIIGENPILKRYADLLGKGQAPQLSWSDLDTLRKNIGPLTQSADPEIRGVAKQLFAGASEDQRIAAASVPGGGTALHDANEAVKARQAALDDLDTLDSKNPESLPGWLTGQANLGSTRLNNFSPYMTPEQSDQLGKFVLAQKATDSKGVFQPELLNTATQAGNKPGMISPQAGAALFSPDTQDALSRFGRLFQGTAPGRSLLATPETATAPNMLTGGAVGGFLGHLFGSPEAGAAAGAALTKAFPLLTGAAAKVTSNPTAMDAVSKVPGLVGGANVIDQGAKAAFPDTYTPPPSEKHSEVDPADVRQFVQSADPKQVAAYVGSKLGPEVAKQFADAGDEGYGAALMSVTSNPAYRKVLYG